MAVSTTVTYPSGVTTPRAQLHAVTIAVTGLSANTTYAALWNRPGTPVSERMVFSDPTGAVTLTDLPQVSGTHTFQLSQALDNFAPSAPTMSSIEMKPAAIAGSTATYTVGP